MLVTTTPNIEGKRIVKYCGVTAGEAILGANVFKDLFASVRDIVGGRSATYEKELQRAREIALAELQERAASIGAQRRRRRRPRLRSARPGQQHADGVRERHGGRRRVAPPVGAAASYRPRGNRFEPSSVSRFM